MVRKLKLSEYFKLYCLIKKLFMLDNTKFNISIESIFLVKQGIGETWHKKQKMHL